MADHTATHDPDHPWSTPIRDLGLELDGSLLAPILAEFVEELRAVGIDRVRPRFYLSTEWGVPDGTTAIAIPFYLARADLTELHRIREGFVEGEGRADILRYLRHEMGHVVNYAYRLFDSQEWVEAFGPISAPYREEYRPEPFSRRFVRHLPGWYAQKHPDEDWAETFAVWMTPGFDWRSEYAGWPVAIGKLDYCDRAMAAISGAEPLVTADDLDEDVGEIEHSVDEHYRNLAGDTDEAFPDLDGELRSIFEAIGRPEQSPVDSPRVLASALLGRIERDLAADVFRWTGAFPERIRPLIRHLASRLDAMGQVYPADREREFVVAVTTMITALAMNWVTRGEFLP